MSVSFRSGQTTETASLVSSNAVQDNNCNNANGNGGNGGGTGSTTSPVDLTAEGLGLFPGPARNRGHSVCLEDEGRNSCVQSHSLQRFVLCSAFFI